MMSAVAHILIAIAAIPTCEASTDTCERFIVGPAARTIHYTRVIFVMRMFDLPMVDGRNICEPCTLHLTNVPFPIAISHATSHPIYIVTCVAFTTGMVTTISHSTHVLSVARTYFSGQASGLLIWTPSILHSSLTLHFQCVPRIRIQCIHAGMAAEIHLHLSATGTDTRSVAACFVKYREKNLSTRPSLHHLPTRASGRPDSLLHHQLMIRRLWSDYTHSERMLRTSFLLWCALAAVKMSQLLVLRAQPNLHARNCFCMRVCPTVTFFSLLRMVVVQTSPYRSPFGTQKRVTSVYWMAVLSTPPG